MSDLFKSIAHNKSDKNELWLKCIANARSIIHARDMSDQEIEKIANASSSPEDFNVIVRWIYTFTRENPNGHQGILSLFKNTDSSRYDLVEWIEAINHFNSWLEEHERKTDWIKLLGYLQCCGESPENVDIKHNFVSLLKNMLETYGYEG
ncbi:hypothetical protein A9Q84_05625 [Halobacteriovorax marinus]|uniref:Uncharacterized protein n=1 Tax=Halobacteriovorax marinus TaxID=97084 RepID=A0A1Y5FGS4_9BACT|nr:hypothetical protein A9Q84_05625 [Halobacteriovorax marinus]